jgi:predicted regulator of Ras-like GTPase activity (Roadblock/LC7/MglB family)
MTVSEQFTVPRAVLLGTEQMKQIDACLDELEKNTGVTNTILTDITGQSIVCRGKINARDAEALAALIAGSHAASAEFGRVLGMTTPIVNLSHEAETYSIYSTNVADALILSMAFEKNVKLGIVRVFVEQTCKRLTEIVNEVRSAPVDEEAVKLRIVDKDFDNFLEKEFAEIIEPKK